MTWADNGLGEEDSQDLSKIIDGCIDRIDNVLNNKEIEGIFTLSNESDLYYLKEYLLACQKNLAKIKTIKKCKCKSV